MRNFENSLNVDFSINQLDQARSVLQLETEPDYWAPLVAEQAMITDPHPDYIEYDVVNYSQRHPHKSRQW